MLAVDVPSDTSTLNLSKQSLLQLLSNPSNAPDNTIQIGEIYSEEILNEILNELKPSTPSNYTSTDEKISDVCRLTGISEATVISLRNQFKSTYGKLGSSKIDFVLDIYGYHLLERQATLEMLSYLVKLVVGSKYGIEHHSYSNLSERFIRFVEKAGGSSALFNLIVQALQNAVKEDVPSHVLDYQEKIADTLAFLWVKENVWRCITLIQLLCLLLKTNDSLKPSFTQISSIISLKFPQDSTKVQMHDDTCNQLVIGFERLQILFFSLVLPFDQCVQFYPNALSSKDVESLKPSFPFVEFASLLVHTNSTIAFLAAVYLLCLDMLDPESKTFSLPITLRESATESLKSSKISIIFSELANIFSNRWLLSICQMAQVPSLDHLVQSTGHALLMSILTAFEPSNASNELIDFHVAVFTENSQLVDQFWTSDTIRHERTFAIVTLIEQFPTSTPSLVRLLSALCNSKCSSRSIFDLLRKGRNTQHIHLERTPDLDIVNEQYDSERNLFNLTVNDHKQLSVKFAGVEMILYGGTTGIMSAEFTDRSFVSWNLPLDGWQFLSRLIQLNQDQQLTTQVVHLFKLLLSEGLALPLDEIVSSISPIFLNSALPIAPDVIHRSGSLIFVFSECIRMEFSRVHVSLSTITDALECLTILLSEFGTNANMIAFSYPYINHLFDPPGLIDLLKSFRGSLDNSRFTLLCSILDFFTLCIKLFDEKSSLVKRCNTFVAETIIPCTAEFSTPTPYSILQLWSALSRFSIASKCRSPFFFFSCFRALLSLPYLYNSDDSSTFFLLSDVFDALSLTLNDASIASISSVKVDSFSLLDKVMIEVLTHWSHLSSFRTFLSTLFTKCHTFYIDPIVTKAIERVVTSNPPQFVYEHIQVFIKHRPKDFICFSTNSITELVTNYPKTLLLLYEQSELYENQLKNIRSSEDFWKQLVKNCNDKVSLQIMTTELVMTLNGIFSESKLPSLLNSINPIDLFSLDTSNDHLTILSKFTQTLILAVNTSLVKLSFNEAALFDKLLRMLKDKTPAFIADIMSLVDTLLRFGQSNYTPSSDTFIQTVLILSSSLLSSDRVIFNICKSTVSLLKCTTHLVDDVIEVLLDLLSSATSTLDHVKTPSNVVATLSLISAISRLIPSAIDGNNFRASRILETVYAHPSVDAFSCLTTIVVSCEASAKLFSQASLLSFAERSINLSLDIIRSFGQFLSAQVCKGGSVDLLVTVAMQLDHNTIDMSHFVTALTTRSTPIVEAYINTVALQPLLDRLCVSLSSTNHSSLCDDIPFISNLKCITAIVLNLNPRNPAFIRIVNSLFPNDDGNICMLGLAHDLHRLACYIITRPHPNIVILENIVLTLSSIKRNQDHSTKSNSILNHLMIQVNQSSMGELKSVREMLTCII